MTLDKSTVEPDESKDSIPVEDVENEDLDGDDVELPESDDDADEADEDESDEGDDGEDHDFDDDNDEPEGKPDESPETSEDKLRERVNTLTGRLKEAKEKLELERETLKAYATRVEQKDPKLYESVPDVTVEGRPIWQLSDHEVNNYLDRLWATDQYSQSQKLAAERTVNEARGYVKAVDHSIKQNMAQAEQAQDNTEWAIIGERLREEIPGLEDVHLQRMQQWLDQHPHTKGVPYTQKQDYAFKAMRYSGVYQELFDKAEQGKVTKPIPKVQTRKPRRKSKSTKFTAKQIASMSQAEYNRNEAAIDKWLAQQ